MQSRPHQPTCFSPLRSLALLLVLVLTGMTAARADEPAAASGTAPAALVSPSVSSTYRLSPYDVIDVSIYNEEDLHTRAKLGADGSVLLPLIQNVQLGGDTVAQATESIRKRYAAGFVKDPHVLVTVLEYRKSTFSIIGQVQRPGIYEIPEGSHMSIVDAILLAGGFTRTAAQNGVKVKRLVKGKAEVLKVHAGSMADDADEAPFYIESGDVIKVPESWF